MTRVATNASFQSALLDLQRAQSRQQDAQNRIATGKIATDLSGFGRSAEIAALPDGQPFRLESGGIAV